MMASSGWIRGLCQLQSGAGQAHPRSYRGQHRWDGGVWRGHPLRYAGTHPARGTDHKPRRKGPSGNLNLTSTEFGVCPAACWEPSNQGAQSIASSARRIESAGRWTAARGVTPWDFRGSRRQPRPLGRSLNGQAPNLMLQNWYAPGELIHRLFSPQSLWCRPKCLPTYTKSRTELFG